MGRRKMGGDNGRGVLWVGPFQRRHLCFLPEDPRILGLSDSLWRIGFASLEWRGRQHHLECFVRFFWCSGPAYILASQSNLWNSWGGVCLCPSCAWVQSPRFRCSGHQFVPFSLPSPTPPKLS